MAHNETYEEFVEKFKHKKTTDDCYTLPEVYEVIAKFVEREYKVDRSVFVRPFYPGGDYENYNYSGKIVVDNPPFSIHSEILKFYAARDIPYFLFAPALTLFGAYRTAGATCIYGGDIVYENGAVINTAFVTNMDKSGVIARTAPELTQDIKDALSKNKKSKKKNLPKYIYPDNVLTSTMLERMAENGIEYKLYEKDAVFIRALDSQRAMGKAIFGAGFLVTDEAVPIANKNTAGDTVIEWELSEREKEIIGNMERYKERSAK